MFKYFTFFIFLLLLSSQHAAAVPLWYNIQPLPQASWLSDVACSADECVAVGGSGASVNIRANASMIAGDPYSDAILYRVMRDTNDFLAFQIGTTNDPYARILKSKNGYRWVATGNKLVRGNSIVVPTGMVKTNSLYVVSGYELSNFQPFVATSPNMQTWTYTAIPVGTFFSSAAGVAANTSGSTVVVVGSFSGATSNVYTSTDGGATWAFKVTPTTASLYAVTWDATNKQFVAAGLNGTIITSPDGINWTDRSITGATLDIRGIDEHNGLLVGVGIDYSGTSMAVYSIDAGATWNYGLNTGTGLYDVAWNGSLMLAVGSEGDIRASYDGFLWFEWDYVEANPPTYYDVAVNDLYTVVTAGSQGRLDYSLDSGATWAKGPATPVLTETFTAVEWVKGINKFVAVGSNVAKTSSTGKSWINATTSPSGTVSDLASNSPVAGQAKLVAVGGTSAYTSTNGSTWTPHVTVFGSTVHGVAASPVSPYTFVAVGGTTVTPKVGTVYSSADSGITWTARTSPITLAAGESLRFNDVFWTDKYKFLSPGIFFAVGTKTLASGDVEGVVIYSYNGITWKDGSNILPLAVRQNNQFLSINGTASGLTSEIFIVGQTSNQFSPAGMIIENNTPSFSVWQQVPLPSTPALHGVVPTNVGGAIAVGKTSVIISKLSDTTPPSQIVAPVDLTLEAINSTPVPLTDPKIQAWLQQFYAKDNRDITILDIQNNAPATFAPNTVTPVSFTVSDKAGNTIATPVVRSITIQDMQPPVVTPPTDIIVASVSGVLGVTNTNPAVAAFLAGATATDNVDGVINPINISNNVPALFPIGTTTVTFSATDSGMPANTGSATANVTVWDAQAPTIVLPTPAHYEIAATSANPVPITDPYVQQYLGLVTAFDNWDPGTLSVSNDAPATFPVGTQVFIDFYATDVYGNVGHNPLNSASITVKDFAPPVITPPADIVIPSTSGLGVFNSNTAIVAFLAGASATDNVDGAITVVSTNNDAPQVFPIGTTTVTFFVDDAQGNRGYASAKVTVWDAQAPIVYLPIPSALTLSAETASGLSVNDPYVQQFINAVVALDDYEGARTVSHNAPANFSLNTKVDITFTATDTYGNVGTAIGSITVIDDTPPILTVPNDISVLATSALGTELSNPLIQTFLAGATATDNVDTSVTVFNDAPSVFPIGTTKVTFFADDVGGNRSIGSASVEVITGSGGTPDAANCLVGRGNSVSWAWLSLVMLILGTRLTRKYQSFERT